MCRRQHGHLQLPKTFRRKSRISRGLRCPVCFFFFNDTATTEIYTLSLHDALPISPQHGQGGFRAKRRVPRAHGIHDAPERSEEHTSELQSQSNLVWRLLLEKKKTTTYPTTTSATFRTPHTSTRLLTCICSLSSTPC